MYRAVIDSSPTLGEKATMTTRILLVDDHPIVREGLRTVLQRKPGWEVVGEASDGEEAIEKSGNLHPDVIVLDITMPKMNGLEVCRTIRQHAPGSDGETPEVLFVTQHDSPQMLPAIYWKRSRWSASTASLPH